MKAALIDVEAKPRHPRDLGEVQDAHAASLAAHAAATAARTAHEENHAQMYQASSDTTRWKAQSAAPALLMRMLETKCNALDADSRYQQLLQAAMVPITVYWKKRHQLAVEELVDALTGMVAEKNLAVMQIVQAASEEDVTLSAMTWMAELEPQHLAFMCEKLRENAS